MGEVVPYLPGFLAAYAILVVGALSPGPSVAMIIGIATDQGRTPALATTLGIALGSLSINILTMLGVGLLLSQAAWAMSVLRILGAAYLLYLAVGSFRKSLYPPSMNPIEIGQRTLLKNLLAGYLLQVTNPKAIAFWLVISSVGAVEGSGPGVKILFVIGAFFISFLGHGVWAVTLSVSHIRAAYVNSRRWIESMLGCFFIFAAYKLSMAEN